MSNLPGVAIGRAKKFFESLQQSLFIRCTCSDREVIEKLLKSVPQVLNMAGKVKVTEEYIEGFIKAMNTFNHQLVYSPLTDSLTHLKPLPGGLERHKSIRLGEYAGHFFEDSCPEDAKVDSVNNMSFVLHYVLGNVHTKTLQIIDPEFNGTSWSDVNKKQFFSKVIHDRIIQLKNEKRSSALGHLIAVENKFHSKKILEEQKSPAETNQAFKSIKFKVIETTDPIIETSSNSTKIKHTPLKCSVQTESRKTFHSSTNSKTYSRKRFLENSSICSKKVSRYFVCDQSEATIESTQKLGSSTDTEDEDFSDIKLPTKSDESLHKNSSMSSIEDNEMTEIRELNRSSQRLSVRGLNIRSSQGSSQSSYYSTSNSQSPLQSSNYSSSSSQSSTTTISLKRKRSSIKSNRTSTSLDIRSFFT